MTPAYQAAVAALARREHTAEELTTILTRAGFAHDAITAAIGQLRDARLLDDARAADARARAAARRGHADPDAIAASLIDRGIPPDAAARAADAALRESPATHTADALIATWLRALPPKLAPAVLRRRILSRLARRGFDEHEARDALDRALSRPTITPPPRPPTTPSPDLPD